MAVVDETLTADGVTGAIPSYGGTVIFAVNSIDATGTSAQPQVSIGSKFVDFGAPLTAEGATDVSVPLGAVVRFNLSTTTINSVELSILT